MGGGDPRTLFLFGLQSLCVTSNCTQVAIIGMWSFIQKTVLPCISSNNLRQNGPVVGTAGQMMVKGGGSTLGRLSDIREVEDKTFIIYRYSKHPS